ncbi:tripartite tricarboxylate transporter substrate-binding protein [Hahella sp. SMD15-11]|uniref:Tripartite tricarboxylate transporter substrate-binding protein n=1 Tax=Thermohahella caldifontis TaxID=3142973 RepID=A0AB39UT46_9GAMM
MVASTIGDYQALVVSKNSPYKTFSDVVKDFEKDPRSVAVGGGSVPGSMDHLVAAMAFEAAGQDPTAVKYIPYDAGGKAMAALLSGEIKLLSTGFGEAVGLAQSGEVRILAITAPERQDVAPDAPTLKEQGYNAEFVNWRGFFAAPGLPEAKRQQFIKALRLMYDTPEWEAVRARNGWVNIFHPGDEFTAFLEQQEKVIGNLMRKLGFL